MRGSFFPINQELTLVRFDGVKRMILLLLLAEANGGWEASYTGTDLQIHSPILRMEIVDP